MSHSTNHQIPITKQDALRVIESVGLPLPASKQSPGWLVEFLDQLNEVVEAGWYASVGMIDPAAKEKRRELREALAERLDVDPKDRRLRRLPDSHIRVLVEKTGWFYQRWWDRTVAVSRTWENATAEGHVDGPFPRIIRSVAALLAAKIEGDAIPADWPQAKSRAVADRIAKRLRKLAERPEAARDAIRASIPYSIPRLLEPHLDPESISKVPLAYDEHGNLVPTPYSDEDKKAILRQTGKEVL